MARRNQPAMEMGRSGTRPWSDAGPGDVDAGLLQSRDGLRRAWAITRWIALVLVCGLGAAAAVGILIGAFYTVVLGL